MKICLSHISALDFWRSPYGAQLAGPRIPFYKADTPYRKRFALPKQLPAARETNLYLGAGKTAQADYGPMHDGPAKLSTKDIAALSALGLFDPCHVLLSSKNDRRQNDHLRYHVCSTELPPRSIIAISDALSVSSPELLFVQMAETLPLIQVIELGYELCGYYSCPGRNGGEMHQHRQLTCVQNLQDFTNGLFDLHGAPKARQALRYVLDGSNSPMETKLSMLLSLPCKLGGYGLPNPQLNANVLLNEPKQRGDAPRFQDIRTCDLLWREGKIAIEYEGENSHQGAQRNRDARRPDELKTIGVDMINITYGRLISPDDMDSVARSVAQRTGHRQRVRVENYAQRQQRLRAELQLLGEPF